MDKVVEIISMIVGLATLGLIITRSQNTAQVITAGSNAVSHMISVATFQNGVGNLGGTFQ